MTAGATGRPASLESRLDAAAAAVAEARRRIARGESGQPEALGLIVGEALGLAAGAVSPRIEVVRARPFLLALLDETERLLETVERERAAAAMQLKELSARDRAGRAYGRRW